MKKIASKILLVTLIVTMFQGICFTNTQDVQAETSSILTTPSTVVSSIQKVSRTARPQVLSNSWIVTATSSGTTIYLYVSKDNGATFTTLCRSEMGAIDGCFSMCSKGTTIYLLSDNNICLVLDRIDVLTQTNIEISGQNRKYVAAVSDMDSCSIATNPQSEDIFIAYSSKSSTAGDGYNIYTGISNNQGSYWRKLSGTNYAYDAITSGDSYNNSVNPSIALMSNGFPIIVYENNNNGSKSIKARYASASGWSEEITISNPLENLSHCNPVITIQQNGVNTGRIWTTWQGKDPTDTTNYNIHCKYSDTNGSSWINGGVNGEKITSGNINQANPTITSNKNGVVFLTWQGIQDPYGDIYGISRVENIWGPVNQLTNSQVDDITSPISCDNYNDFEYPLTIWQDNQNIGDKVLLHFDGANNGTTFTDNSGKLWTANGNAVTSTSQLKLGTATAFFDGSGDYISTPDSADFTLGKSNFTIDFQFKRNAISNLKEYLCGQGDSTGSAGSISTSININVNNTVTASLFVSATTVASITSTTTVADTSWHHIAFSRNGKNLELYIDGAKSGTMTSVTSLEGLSAIDATSTFSIGRLGVMNSNYFNGYVDEFRFSKGNVKWNKNFAIPTVAYSLENKTANISFYNNFGYLHAPSIGTSSINNDTVITKDDVINVPTITVMDEDYETLSCKYFLDNETVARDIKNIVGTSYEQNNSFIGFDTSALLGGQHSIRYEICDGFQTIVKKWNFTVVRETQIEVGRDFSLLLKPDGTIWAWGLNSVGQLGDETTTYINKTVPAKISRLNNIVSIAAGENFVVALKSDGTVWSWGGNQYGQLGNGGTSSANSIPTQIQNFGGIKSIKAGATHCLALRNDGTLFSWGGNGNGQLGNGSTNNLSSPTAVRNPSGESGNIGNIDKIYACGARNFAIKKDGMIYGWGNNGNGELGLGYLSSYYYPILISSFGTGSIKKIVGASVSTLILKNDGSVMVCGYNNNGSLGFQNSFYVLSPTTIPNISNVIDISTSYYYSIFTTAEGKVYSIGNNDYGQFGNNSTISNYIPMQATMPNSVTTLKVATGNFSCYSLFTNKKSVFAMGQNFYGQLGDGTINNRTAPTEIPALSLNTAPIINTSKIDPNALVSPINLLNASIPMIFVSDLDGNTLTCRYYVDGNTEATETKTLTNTVAEQATNFSPLALANLSEGNHLIKYTVDDGYVVTSAEAKFFVDKTAPEINKIAATHQNNILNVEVYANDQVSGISSYTYKVDNQAPITSNSAYFQATTTEAGIKHTVLVTVKDTAGNETSQTCNVMSQVGVPSLTVTTTGNALKLNISTSNPDDTQYQITCNDQFINEIGELSETPVWMTLPDKELLLSNLAFNTPYTFKVKARNKENIETDYSMPKIATLTVAMPTIPLNVSGSAIKDTVTLTWSPVSSAIYYEVEIDNEIIEKISALKYVKSKMEINSEHAYRVRAVSQYGAGAWSGYVKVKIIQGVPISPLNQKEKYEDTSATISWDPQFGVTSYQVEFNGAIVAETTSNYYKLYGLTANTSYNYRIKAVNTIGESAWTTLKTFKTASLSTPQPTIADIKENSIRLSWPAVTGATGYEIKRDGVVTSLGNVLLYDHLSLTPNTLHKYQVRATLAGTTNEWSDEISVTTLPLRPAKPTGFLGVATDTLIKLIWNAVSLVTGYDLEIDGVIIENDASTTYTHTELDPLTEHVYRIRSKTDLIESDWTDYIRISTLPLLPKAPKSVYISSVGQVSTVNWEAIPGSTSYDIEVDGVVYSAGNSGKYTHRGVVLGQEHKYRIRTISAVGVSDWSGYVVNNSIKAKSTKNKDLELGLTASHIKDFSKYQLTVYYNKDVLKVTDLCSKTKAKELTAGLIKEQNVTITSFKEGQITFTVDKPIEPGYDWTGIINNITFNGKITGGTTIDYTVYIIPE